jgi:hypothetical protein
MRPIICRDRAIAQMVIDWLLTSHPPLININWFHEMLIGNLLDNDTYFNIWVAFHCRAHNFTSSVHKVAKCDENQWTLIRLQYHLTRIAGQCDLNFKVCISAWLWRVIIWVFGHIVGVLWSVLEVEWKKNQDGFPPFFHRHKLWKYTVWRIVCVSSRTYEHITVV